MWVVVCLMFACCLFVCLFVSLFVCLVACLFVCLFDYCLLYVVRCLLLVACWLVVVG